MTIEAPAERQPTYRDTQLSKLMKDLRADVRPYPNAKITLERAERRLRYVLRVLTLWDTSHAEKAEMLIQLGMLEAANTSACLIFDQELRERILPHAPVQFEANNRLEEAIALDREVLL